ncbi:MAG: hypothetical protein ACLPVY_00645 [Acidimicrobiia bacterium]
MKKTLRNIMFAGALTAGVVGAVGAVAVPAASAAPMTGAGTVTPVHTAPPPAAIPVTTVTVTFPTSSTVDQGFDVLRLTSW